MSVEQRNSGLRLSVLDQSPVPAGSEPAQALQNSIALARRVDELGFTRFWMSEHHAMDLLLVRLPRSCWRGSARRPNASGSVQAASCCRITPR